MKTKKILGLMLLLVAAFGFYSCSDDDDNGGKAGTALSVTDVNGTELSSIDFNIGQSTMMIGIKTDGDWTVSIPEADTSWVSITPHGGPGWAISDSTASNTRSYVKVEVPMNQGDQRQTTLTVSSGSLTTQIPITQRGITTDPNDPFQSVWSMVASLKMGYNLGNTLDSNPHGDWWDPSTKTVSDWETAWGQPVTTQTIIDSITAKGFNIIRVPVTWGPHMDANNNIDKAWMDRVEQVVNYVLNDGAYCIINVMHDTGADGAWLYADMDAYPQQTVKYQAIWRQIAERFKDYGDHLIFESMNEILDKNYSWTAPAAGDGAYTAINKLQQDFVNTVRATGGNNEYRNLAITTYSATGNNKVALDALEVPTDVHPNHIYGTIHSYDPYNFCNYNAGKNAQGEYDYNIYMWNSDCEAEIDRVYGQVNDRFNELGIPYIYGEFGAIDGNKDIAERVKYATYVATKMRQYHTTGLWWMGLYDRKTGKWEQTYTDANNRRFTVNESRIVNALRTAFGF